MSETRRAAGALESALLFTFIAHGLGMLTMAVFLLPGMPGGPHLDIASRAVYVAGHPWIWRAGWFDWQLTALSDLLLAIALLITRWIPKLPATLTMIATVLGVIPDQYAQAIWTWPGIHLAQSAVNNHDYTTYLAFETHAFRLMAGYGTIGYLTAALGWTWCFAVARTWNRRLTILSVFTWGLFGISTAVLFLPPSLRLPVWAGKITAAGNAIAFVLLMIWLIGVTELVLRRNRPTTANGHWANWRHPSTGLLARLLDVLANSRFVRSIGEYLPTLAMASDITNVIYINYLVRADQLKPFLPAGLELQTVGPDGSHALFSILTYRHGHFGPMCFGPFRRWWPSPIQSNWRIYVIDPVTKHRGVHFVTTAITSTPHALATRLLSEGVPMHVPANAEVQKDAVGTFHILLEPETGSAPDLRGEFHQITATELPGDWQSSFSSWIRMLEYCLPQDRALSPQPWHSRVARQEISLGIPLNACLPLSCDLKSAAAESIVGNAKPVCFLVERVAFRFLKETFDRVP